jgi:hypothetical protein
MWRYFGWLALVYSSLAGGAGSIESKTPKQIYQAAHDSIVVVYATDDNGRPLGQGTGFFIDDGSTIVTNYHVVEGANSWMAKLSDGGMYPIVKVRAADREADIALLVVNTKRPTLKMAKKLPEVGDDVVVIGHPRGYENTLSVGIVSAIGGPSLKYDFQISAPISPGNSGGPVISSSGLVVGVATATRVDAQNLNFAQSTAQVERLIRESSAVIKPMDPAAKASAPMGQPLGPVAQPRERAPNVPWKNDVESFQPIPSARTLSESIVPAGAEMIDDSRATSGLVLSLKNYGRCRAAGLKIDAKFKAGANKSDPLAFSISFEIPKTIAPGEQLKFWYPIPELVGHGAGAPNWNRWFPIIEVVTATEYSCPDQSQ